MTPLKISGTVLLVVAGCSAALGCGHEQTKPAAVATTGSVVTPAHVAAASPGKAGSTIFLADDLRKACGITAVDTVNDTPKFAFDQTSILPEDRDVLAAVARCLTTGPLKGRSVLLIGRADPRGSQEYNMALGERRSNAVEKYLGGLGVGSTQMSETSRGALDATGSGESAWRQDRRVDIDLP